MCIETFCSCYSKLCSFFFLKLCLIFSLVYLFSFARLISGRDTVTAWGNYCSPVISHPPPCPWCERWRIATTPRSRCPTLFKQCVGALHHTELWTLKSCERGPTVYHPYPRMPESPTICRCNYKSSTFYSVILRPWVGLCWSGQGSNPWPPVVQYTPNLSKRAAVRSYLLYVL